MLTQKQENFTLDLFKELPEVTAYENHYSTANMSKNAVYVEACRLSKKPKIALRLAELRQPAVDSTKMLVQEREERLSDIAREELSSAKGTPLRGPNISAIQELNKMDGSYAPEKHAVLGAIIIEVVYKETKLIGEDNATE